MEEVVKKKAKVSKGEVASIIIYSILGVAGLVFVVLGFISAYLPKKSSENWTGGAAFTEAMHMSYRVFGAILLVAAALIAVICLNVFAKKSDVDNERAERRAQRLKIIADSDAVSVAEEKTETASPKEEAVEVTSTPKEDTK